MSFHQLKLSKEEISKKNYAENTSSVCALRLAVLLNHPTDFPMTESNKDTTERIENLLMSKYNTLSKNQKKVADFIINDMNEAAFLSVVEIGERCGASKATVVRFAQSVGYDGFLDFRNALHNAVHNKFSNLERFPFIAETDKETIYEVAKQDVGNINQTVESLNLDSFKNIVNKFSEADTIFTYGKGISSLMSQVLAYSLSQVATKSKSVSGMHLSYEEEMMYMTPADCLVVLSFPPYSKETLDIAQLAKERGISVIAFTDRRTSPVNRIADDSLFIQSENMLFTNSFAAISMVINAITTELSVKDKQKTLSFIKEVNKLMTDNNRFSE